MIYASGLVAPGQHIPNITLSRELDEGICNAILHVQAYRMDENTTAANKADMEIQLIVK